MPDDSIVITDDQKARFTAARTEFRRIGDLPGRGRALTAQGQRQAQQNALIFAIVLEVCKSNNIPLDDLARCQAVLYTLYAMEA